MRPTDAITSAFTSIAIVSPARPGSDGNSRISRRLIDIATNRSPASAADAPAVATKNDSHWTLYPAWPAFVASRQRWLHGTRRRGAVGISGADRSRLPVSCAIRGEHGRYTRAMAKSSACASTSPIRRERGGIAGMLDAVEAARRRGDRGAAPRERERQVAARRIVDRVDVLDQHAVAQLRSGTCGRGR